MDSRSRNACLEIASNYILNTVTILSTALFYFGAEYSIRQLGRWRKDVTNNPVGLGTLSLPVITGSSHDEVQRTGND